MATISIPGSVPSAADDAKTLWHAFEGWGSDKKTLIEVLGHRTAAQRAEIAAVYAALYKEQLTDRLHSELSMYIHVQKAMIWWTMDPAQRDAKLAHKALQKIGDQDIWVLIEVACAYSPGHLVAVRRAYCYRYAASLEEDVAICSSLTESAKKLLVHLVTSYRYTGENVDDNLAKLEAAKLADSIRKKQPLNEQVIRIISLRSKPQIRATFLHYRQDYGKAIDEDIDGLDSSQFSALLKVAIWCLASPEKHFAQVIRGAIEGLGTDEDTLSRAIVCRAEIDMKMIKEEYKLRYKTTVAKDVADDTSGYYRDFLLALVGIET